MPKYLIQANYVGEGVKGLLKEGGSSRRVAVEQVAQALGGSVESFYYAFGDTDVFIVADMPDNVSAATAVLIANASGAIAAKTTVLMTPAEVDEVSKKSVAFRPPGQ